MNEWAVLGLGMLASSALTAGFRKLAPIWRHRATKLFWLPVFLYAALWLEYLASSNVFDHNEAQVLSASWLAFHPLQGAVYGNSHLGAPYAMFYGPFLYVLIGGALTFLGAHVVVAKAMVLTAILAGLACFRQTLITLGTSPRWRFSILGGLVLAMLSFYGPGFWIRPDPFLLALVCFAFYLTSVTGLRTPLRAAALGVVLGIGCNLKVHAVLYLAVPIFLFLSSRPSATRVIAFFTAAVLTLAFPFTLESIDLAGYRHILEVGGRWARGSAFRFDLIPCLLGFSLAPLGLMAARIRSTRHEEQLPGWIFLISAIVVMRVASIPGAGVTHLFPLLPTGFYFLARCTHEKSPRSTYWIQCAFLAQLFFLSSTVKPAVLTEMTSIRATSLAGIQDELDAAQGELKGKTWAIGVGVETNYFAHFYRFQSVWDGNPFFLDGTVLMNLALLGDVDWPALQRRFDRCEISTWLIPRGAEVFRMRNWYDGSDLFPPEFRQAFLRMHTLYRQSNNFDWYQCHKLREYP